MTRQEAQLVLQALRPNDPGPSPEFAEALTLAESDPELKTWWRAQQEFDHKVVAKLSEIPVPGDLRATLIAGGNIETFAPMPSYPFWLAAAAAVAILCAVGSIVHYQHFGPQAQAEYTLTVLPLLKNDAPDLGMLSSDRDKIVAWLKERQAPLGSVPDKLGERPPLGCQKYQVHGHTVTLICFAMEGGGEAHLFIIDRDALADPPKEDVPEFNDINGWSVAAWSDDHMSYLLATQAGDEALKKLL
jgi:hypothetical protein